MFLTFFFEPFLVGKVMKENLLRKVRKSEKRKVKNIRKYRNSKLAFQKNWESAVVSCFSAVLSLTGTFAVVAAAGSNS